MATLNTTVTRLPMEVTATITLSRRFRLRLRAMIALLKIAALIAPFRFEVRSTADEDEE